MKQIGSLFLAAVLGSVCTVASFHWLDLKSNGVKLEYMVPTSNVAYKTTDKNAVGVGPDFTTIAEAVTPAVVYIKSTQQLSNQQRENQQVCH